MKGKGELGDTTPLLHSILHGQFPYVLYTCTSKCAWIEQIRVYSGRKQVVKNENRTLILLSLNM